MKMESIGIIIGLRPFGERDCIAHIFTRDHGVMAGMLRGGAIARKNKPLVGQFGPVSWNARLDSNLGVFHFESSRNLAAPIMSDAAALSRMNSAFALLQTLLPEREGYPALFDDTLGLLGAPMQSYISWEINLLRSLGYALDMTHCSNCGRTDNLTHMSRRTGRAVCADCAVPWLAQCFPLPPDLAATRYFISQIAAEHGTTLPTARQLLNND